MLFPPRLWLPPHAALYGSGGASYDADAQAFFDEMTSSPDATRKGHINTLVLALKAGGNAWAKLDWLSIPSANEHDSLLNLRNPAQTATNVSGTSFTADVGFTGDGAADHLNTSVNPNSGGINFTTNSASIFAWNYTAAPTNTHAIAGYDDNGIFTTFISPSYSFGTTSLLNITGGTSMEYVHGGDASGFLCLNRSDADSIQYYVNGANVKDSDANNASGVGNANLTFLRGASLFYGGQIGPFGFGGSMDATEQDELYDALNAYLAAI